MKKFFRIGFYILINIIFSAVTTLTVLWLWERANPRPEIPTTNVTNNTPALQPGEALPDQDIPEMDLIEEEIQVTIHSIVGAGNLDVEYVEIRNQSSGAVDPTGWKLIDQDGNTLIFPSYPTLVLHGGGAVKVYSKTGINSAIELFWQSDKPIWESGETASLLDASGNILATYSIP